MTLTYNNYHIYDSYANLLFPKETYTNMIICLCMIAITLIVFFFTDNILRVVWFYATSTILDYGPFIQPSLTENNMQVINDEKKLLSKFQEAKQLYRLDCNIDNILLVTEIATNTSFYALTMAGDKIQNCQSILQTIEGFKNN